MEDSERIDKLADDLEFIKQAMKRNQVVLRDVFSPLRIRFLVLYIGTATVLVSLLFQYCIGLYGSYGTTPHTVRLFLLVVVAVVAATGVLLKFTTLNRTAKRVDARFTVWSVLGKYLLPFIFHVYLPLLALMAGAIVFCATSGRSADIVGVVAVGIGFFMNSTAVNVRIYQYQFLGYWLLASGVLSFFVPGVSAAVWLAISFGGGCYALVVGTALVGRRSRPDAVRG